VSQGPDAAEVARGLAHQLSLAYALLGEALMHLRLHDSEYHFRTPRTLLARIEAFLASTGDPGLSS
jgi:hypothetical protein